MSNLNDKEQKLFLKLKELRLSFAKESKLPAYTIFNDDTLKEIASFKPTTNKEFLKIKCPISKAAQVLNKFFKKYQINLAVDQRYFPISNNKISKLNVIFSSSFGRQLEYYTGMVFKIDIKSNNKIKNIINGGRYDQLISDLGSKTQVSAVGAALNLNY